MSVVPPESTIMATLATGDVGGLQESDSRESGSLPARARRSDVCRRRVVALSYSVAASTVNWPAIRSVLKDMASERVLETRECLCSGRRKIETLCWQAPPPFHCHSSEDWQQQCGQPSSYVDSVERMSLTTPCWLTCKPSARAHRRNVRSVVYDRTKVPHALWNLCRPGEGLCKPHRIGMSALASLKPTNVVAAPSQMRRRQTPGSCRQRNRPPDHRKRAPPQGLVDD
jgi:hypothetical protein